ncbi:MAG: hypothetical protein HY099_03560 [Nitrospirae bacterium]|nr:hypothetical protein [Nitrospirota bacterium]
MKVSRVMVVLAAIIFCVAMLAGVAMAADKLEVKGKIKGYDLNNKTVVVTVDGKDMTFVVEHEEALKKLDDRIVKGDKVKIKYIIKDGKNIIKGSNDLKGANAGC